MYVTASPCWSCFKQIANTGMKRIVFGEFYRDARIFDVGKQLGITLDHLPEGADAPTPSLMAPLTDPRAIGRGTCSSMAVAKRQLDRRPLGRPKVPGVRSEELTRPRRLSFFRLSPSFHWRYRLTFG